MLHNIGAGFCLSCGHGLFCRLLHTVWASQQDTPNLSKPEVLNIQTTRFATDWAVFLITMAIFLTAYQPKDPTLFAFTADHKRDCISRACLCVYYTRIIAQGYCCPAAVCLLVCLLRISSYSSSSLVLYSKRCIQQLPCGGGITNEAKSGACLCVDT